MKGIRLLALALAVSYISPVFAQQDEHPTVKTKNGLLEGTVESGIHCFKGIPFAQPPVGKLRWAPPVAVSNWTGTKKANQFGPRAMQLPLFGDMNFRSSGMSEDCLYLNIWTPPNSAHAHLPVLVYYYGGGFVAGDGSEPRYEGLSMAKRGIIAVTVNYRLGIFGFLAHPGLTAESPHHASGNYGLMDQAAALQWVHDNIDAFGGDPDKITIAGESAGSFAVSALMASPLSKNLINGAIGESGSLLGLNSVMPLNDAEQIGSKFAAGINATDITALRAMPAEQLLQATGKPSAGRFPVTTDGYFFPTSPIDIYTRGQQAHVPLLVGWNSMEGDGKGMIGNPPSIDSFNASVKKMYGEKANDILNVYRPSTTEDLWRVATDLASDRFIGFSTWRWSDLQSQTGHSVVYRYWYKHPRPPMRAEMGNAREGLAGGVIRDSSKNTNAPKRQPAKGAVHSAEIEYAMGNLPTNLVFNWTADDYKVSATMQGYFENFIKKGTPNGNGLPNWPAVTPGRPAAVMQIDVQSAASTELHRDRYLLLAR